MDGVFDVFGEVVGGLEGGFGADFVNAGVEYAGEVANGVSPSVEEEGLMGG